MRGSAGGGGFGGGFAVGYAMSGGSDEGIAAAAIGMFGLLTVFGVAAGGYAIADHFDQPHRTPIVASLTAQSASACFNVRQDPSAYTELKKELMSIWSSTLKKVAAQPNLTICADSKLGDVYLPYKNENHNDGNLHNGEYRVAAVVYTDAQGHRTVVTKPESFRKASQSSDLEPDVSQDTGSVLKEALFNAGTAPKMDLGNGVSAQILLQRDGVYQYQPNAETHDEEGLVWANPTIQQQTAQQYSMNWSARVSSAGSYSY